MKYHVYHRAACLLLAALFTKILSTSCGRAQEPSSELSELLIPAATEDRGAIITRMTHQGRDVVALRECLHADFIAMLNDPRSDIETAVFTPARMIPYTRYINEIASVLGIPYDTYLNKSVDSHSSIERAFFRFERALETRQQLNFRNGSFGALKLEDVISPLRRTSNLTASSTHVDIFTRRQWYIAGNAPTNKAEANSGCARAGIGYDSPTLEEALATRSWFLDTQHFLGFAANGQELYGEMPIGRHVREQTRSIINSLRSTERHGDNRMAEAVFWVRDGADVRAVNMLENGEYKWATSTNRAVQLCMRRHFGRLGISMILRPRGILVAFVKPDSPASKAGLRAGDLITELDGRSLVGTDFGVFSGLVASHPRKTISITWETNADGRTDNTAESRSITRNVQLDTPPVFLRLGIEFAIQSVPGSSNVRGAWVRSVSNGSLAEEYGLRVNDYITHINSRAIESQHDLNDAVNLLQGRWNVRLEVRRHRNSGNYSRPETIDIDFNR